MTRPILFLLFTPATLLLAVTLFDYSPSSPLPKTSAPSSNLTSVRSSNALAYKPHSSYEPVSFSPVSLPVNVMPTSARQPVPHVARAVAHSRAFLQNSAVPILTSELAETSPIAPVFGTKANRGWQLQKTKISTRKNSQKTATYDVKAVGNQLVHQGQVIQVESRSVAQVGKPETLQIVIQDQPVAEVVAPVAVQPENMGTPAPRTSRLAVAYNYEDELFLTKWGSDAYDLALRAALPH